MEGDLEAGAQNLGLAEEGVGYALDEHNRELITPEMESQLEDAKAKIIARRARGERPLLDPVTRRRVTEAAGDARRPPDDAAAGGRADRHRQALRAGPRQQEHRSAHPGRHDPRHRRRERRRQIDADEHPLRLLSGRSRHHPRRRPGTPDRQPRGRDRGRHRHGPPALHAGRAVHGAGEPAARRRGRRDARRRRGAGARRDRARSSANTASRSTSTRWCATCRSASSSGSRS